MTEQSVRPANPDSIAFSQGISEFLTRSGISENFSPDLDAFEQSVQRLRHAAFIGAVFEDKTIPRPVLGFYLAVSNPISYDDREQNDELHIAGDAHGRLALRLDPTLDTFLELIDPRGANTAKDFALMLRHAAGRDIRGTVIGQRNLREPSSR